VITGVVLLNPNNSFPERVSPCNQTVIDLSMGHRVMVKRNKLIKKEFVIKFSEETEKGKKEIK
jgi:hypothetical protein